jgi:hypothetical protein
MNQNIQAGDHIEPMYCSHCGAFQPATVGYGPVVIDSGPPVSSVLRVTCDVCGTVLGTTPEAAPVLAKALKARGKVTSFRVPRSIVSLAKEWTRPFVGDVGDTAAVILTVKAYVGSVLDDADKLQKAADTIAHTQSAVLQQSCDVPVSIQANSELLRMARVLATKAHVRGTSEVFRRVVLAAQNNPDAKRELHKLATIYA